jgi:hypothetical protein
VAARVRRLFRVATLAGFMGLLLGYVAFYSTFPSASIPATGETNPLPTFGALFGAAILVGLLSDDLLAGVLQAFLALPIAAGVASLLSLSPVFGGLIVVRPDDVIFFTLRSGFPLFFLSVPIIFVGSVIGIILQERFGLGPY